MDSITKVCVAAKVQPRYSQVKISTRGKHTGKRYVLRAVLRIIDRLNVRPLLENKMEVDPITVPSCGCFEEPGACQVGAKCVKAASSEG